MNTELRYVIWCEYDLGIYRRFFDTVEEAEAFARKAIADVGIEESFEELKNKNLIAIEEWENLREV